MTQPSVGVGSVTVDGTTITGTTQGVSGAVGGMPPTVAGRPAIPLLGTESDTTSQREACPAGDRQDYWGCINRRQ
jgi:hypothetical protein